MRVNLLLCCCHLGVAVVLHSKKSHKGNWEITYSHLPHQPRQHLVAFKEIPQRELRDWCYSCSTEWAFCCLLHSKKSHKGNWEWEAVNAVANLAYRLEELHSKKSHKGNWESGSTHAWSKLTLLFMLHSKKSHKGNWEYRMYCTGCTPVFGISCIQRNPTKGIERVNLIGVYIGFGGKSYYRRI